MRTLLYFNLRDNATARLAQARLGDLSGTPTLVAGPWFVQRDNQPVDGLPTIDVGQTTYREEAAITGIFIGAIVGALVIFRYGVSAGAGATAVAYVGAVTLGAMIGWWVSGLVGGKISRLELWPQNAQIAPGHLLMIVSCDSRSKETLRQIINELGGVGVDEHSDLMPSFRWL
ncbi:hypothetical protein CupriaWKF_33735 [Cupriavidus sp. WKF15]|uniref:hypothetical protein n=1 Tax=Cupriavidus sp. WKF15 TaxID=3032282 RepID=UPI0023E12EC9|nr:hypothetical protein [Cupriavidus sp. WKF15]WER50503.1 hypothetical protein CupriaWKF_33735 [Cupriavidus sp. WKF15]